MVVLLTHYHVDTKQKIDFANEKMPRATEEVALAMQILVCSLAEVASQ